MATMPAGIVVAPRPSRGVSTDHRASCEAECWKGLAACAARHAVACSWKDASAMGNWVTLPPSMSSDSSARCRGLNDVTAQLRVSCYCSQQDQAVHTMHDSNGGLLLAFADCRAARCKGAEYSHHT